MSKDFKVVSAMSVERLVDILKDHSLNEWEIIAYFQEFGATKILLQKELK